MADGKGEFWAFSLNVYGQAGVPDACLALQDRFDADVNLVLWCAWLGASGRRLTTRELRAAAEAVEPWQAEVVFVLRALRRRLKAGPHPAPSAATDALRQAVKQNELLAERIQHDLLESLARGRLWNGGAEDPAAAAVGNVVSLLREGHGNLLLDEIAPVVTDIVSAALPDVGREAVAAQFAGTPAQK